MTSLPSVARKYYDYSHYHEYHDVKDDLQQTKEAEREQLVSFVRESIIGEHLHFQTPFGVRKIVYCDYTASGRSVSFIENYIQTEVLPLYGNTHTTTSITGRQSTFFRHEARDYIKRSMNGKEEDVLLFCGSGTTSAVNKLIELLNLRRFRNKEHSKSEENQEELVVFVSICEHHSNLLPWRELNARIITINENRLTGELNIVQLKEELQKYQNKKFIKIGAFTAASNITGIYSNSLLISFLLHLYDSYSFWDYATAGPYCKLDMNPLLSPEQMERLLSDISRYHLLSTSDSNKIEDDQKLKEIEQKMDKLVSKDAIYLSPHKFLGGVGTPGVLLAKRSIICNDIPSLPGGGTVFFVTEKDHRYVRQIEEREEGGTPDIIGSIRAGLTFQLKDQISTSFIEKREKYLIETALEKLKKHQSIHVLGSTTLPRAAVLSFMISHPTSKLYLHHNYVGALLNDFFGIQARGGCVCAGPYAQQLMGIDYELAKQYEDSLIAMSSNDEGLDAMLPRERDRRGRGHEILRPGFLRLNFHYTICDETLKFILSAICRIADYGWKLLPLYQMNLDTGEWMFRNWAVNHHRKWMNAVTYFKSSSLLSSSDRNDETNDDSSIDNGGDGDDGGDDGGDVGMPRGVKLLREVGFFVPKDEGKKKKQSGLETYSDDASLIAKIRQGDYHLYYEEVIHQFDEMIENEEVILLNTHANSLSSQSIVFSGMKLRWFLLPSEARDYLNHETPPDLPDPPFVVKDYDREIFSILERSTLVNERNGSDNNDNNNDDNNGGDNESGSADCEVRQENENVDFNEFLLSDFNSDDESNNNDIIIQQNDGQTSSPSSSSSSSSSLSSSSSSSKTSMYKFHPPSHKIMKGAIEAIEKYNMIQDGDRVLICISGGKDSLSMLHFLRYYQFIAVKKGVKFEIAAATIDPQTPETFDPSPLISYMKHLGVPYFFESEGIMQRAKDLETCTSICSYCSRMKRGMLYSCARREGYNVLSMGQHLDDLAESFFMSILHNGLLRTMKVNYYVQQGDLRVIRPLCYVRERDLAKFAKKKNLPVISENCPACFVEPKERHRIKQLLASQENMYPGVFTSIRTSIEPLMGISECGVEGTEKALKTKKKKFLDTNFD